MTVYQTLLNKKTSARILVMRYRFIGDTLLTVPFLKHLHQSLPEANIDMLVAPNSGEVLENCPYIHNLIEWDTTRKHRYESGSGKPRSFGSALQLLRHNHYDAAFVLKRSFSSALLAFLAGIPIRVGFNTELRGGLLTHRIPYDTHQHEMDSFLANLIQTGFPSNFAEQHQLQVWLTDAEKEQAQQHIATYQAFENISVHLTSSNPVKEWPTANTLVFLEHVLQAPNRHVHCFGAASDKPVYQQLVAQLPKALQNKITLWCGQLSLRESLALLAHMRLMIGVDSGTLHMARAVNVPTVALFGPMNEQKWQPPGAVVVRAANSHPGDTQSMSQLTPEQVLLACKPFLTI